MKPDIRIDKSGLDTILYDDEDDCLRGCKCNKCKQWKLANEIKRD